MTDQKKAIKWMISFSELIPTTKGMIEPAMNSEFKDLEDAILFFTATENSCEAFITQNIKDFPEPHPIPVLTPNQMLEKLHESN